ncbi:MAG: T9SS type A sorting domain-containing protein [Chitinophagales bacterium]|nr:T9SS type A sorting domain-containing protein [Chitinophagales bacterium]
MKKEVFTFYFSLVVTYALQAQWVSIPDTNFGNWLDTSGYSQCLQGNSVSGWQLDTTCNAVVNATYVNCSNKGIKNLSGIQYFKSAGAITCAGGFALEEIPALPSALVNLEVPMGKLTSLPALPSSLSLLVCYNNKLQALPPLPAALKYLNCDNNQLTVLPALPPTLQKLICSANQLTVIDSIPATLDWLMCYSNVLTHVGKLPDSLTNCWLHNNPNLVCLPMLTKIKSLNFSNTGVVCIPNYGAVVSSNPPLNSLPFCYSSNPNNCSQYSSVFSSSFPAFSFSPFPNPTSSQLNISIGEEQIGSTVAITDLTGREVMVAKLTNSNTQLQTDYLQKGLYLAILTTPIGQKAVKKIVKE